MSRACKSGVEKKVKELKSWGVGGKVEKFRSYGVEELRKSG
jgi:hypothetical protein